MPRLTPPLLPLSLLAHSPLLEELEVSGCERLAALPGLDQLAALTHLDVSYCASLARLPSLSGLTLLRELNASNCANLEEAPDLPASLRDCYFHECPQLRAVRVGSTPLTIHW